MHKTDEYGKISIFKNKQADDLMHFIQIYLIKIFFVNLLIYNIIYCYIIISTYIKVYNLFN